MKIAYITDERYPSVHTDTQQVIKTIDALGSLGVTVDLIAPRLLTNLGLNKKKRKEKICDYYNVEGHFNLLDLLIFPASDLRVEKFFHGIFAPIKTKKNNYDVAYTRNMLPLQMCVKLGVPVLFETYRALSKTNPKKWKILQKASLSKHLIGVSTHSEYSRQAMIEAGMNHDKIRAIPNGFDPKDFENLPSKKEARAQVGFSNEDRKIIVYTGHIRKDKGIDSILDMAKEATEHLFLIVGGKNKELENLQKDIQVANLNNVILTGQVPISQVPIYLSSADVLLLPPSIKPLQKATVLPMKTFTYLAANRPILAPDLPDTQGVLVHEQNCIKVEPDNPKAAAHALSMLLEDEKLSSTLAKNALADSQKYTWKGRASRIIDFLQSKCELK